MAKHVGLLCASLLLSSCGVSTTGGRGGTTEYGGDDLAAGGDDAAMPDPGADLALPGPVPDAGPMSCDPATPDQAGCACTPGMSRPCYPNDIYPATRGRGLCKAGTQSCVGGGEFSFYGACTGAVTPAKEVCTDMRDHDCNGKSGCTDPACAGDPACNHGCKDGQTRPCYDGPPGTENVGICRDGTQTCTNGAWPANCPGEHLPEKEHCDDLLDHDCNHLPGCLDLFSCIFDPVCQPHCSMPDNGCTCPMGAGDNAMCPQGTIGVSHGLDYECCPCTGDTCGNPGCCATQACANDPQCVGMNCVPLPAMCNGMQNADCDDFPEDCDEPCCPCRMCP